MKEKIKKLLSSMSEIKDKDSFKLLMIYRLKDPFGNKESLKVKLFSDGRISYSLYGSWQTTGIPFSLNNLNLKKKLPSYIKKFSNIKSLDKEIQNVLSSGVHRIDHVDFISKDIEPPKLGGSEMTVKDAINMLKKLPPGQKVMLKIQK